MRFRFSLAPSLCSTRNATVAPVFAVAVFAAISLTPHGSAQVAPNLPSAGISSPASAPTPGELTSDSKAGPSMAALSPEDQGDLHMIHHRYQAAIEAYRKAPLTSPVIWNKIGLANQQMQGIAEARKSYDKALKLDPKNADALNNLASICYSLKDFRAAERLYRQALKSNPNSATIHKNLGTDLLAENKFKKGWESYRQAMALDPGIFERSNPLRVGEPTPAHQRGAMNYYLAKCYVHEGLPELAVRYLRLAMDQGFTDSKRLTTDREFLALHGYAGFDQLLVEQSTASIQPVPQNPVKSESKPILR